MRPVLFILNPTSGPADRDPDILPRAREIADWEVRVTEGAGDAERWAGEAVAEGRTRVVVGGGDGTVHEVVRGLVAAGSESGDGDDVAPPAALPELAILPLGTGNDLARGLGIPLDVEAAWTLAGTPSGTDPDGARVSRMDVVELTLDDRELVAVNAVVVGSGGRLGQILDEEMKARWGPLSYLRSAAEVAFELEPATVELAMDDEAPRTLEILNLVLANGSNAAAGVPIAPGASPLDGDLEVVLVSPAELPRLLALLPALLRGQDPDADVYEHRKAARVRVRSGDGGTESPALPVSIDGESHEARTLEARIRAGALPVVLPREAGPAD